MENKYLTPFIDATIMVLETMAFVKPVVGETCIWNNEKTVAEVIGLISLLVYPVLDQMLVPIKMHLNEVFRQFSIMQGG